MAQPKKASLKPLFEAFNGGPEGKDSRFCETFLARSYKDKENCDFLVIAIYSAYNQPLIPLPFFSNNHKIEPGLTKTPILLFYIYTFF